MRHAFAPPPKPPGSLGVRQAPSPAALVAPAGFALQFSSSEHGAPIGTIELEAIAPGADQHLHAATFAEKEASGIVHRRSAIGRRAIDRPAAGVLYCLYACACHGGGTTFGYDLQVYPSVVPGFLLGLIAYQFSDNSATLSQGRLFRCAHVFTGEEPTQSIETKTTPAVESLDELHEHNGSVT